MKAKEIIKLKKSLIKGIRDLQIENKLKRGKKYYQTKQNTLRTYSMLLLTRQLETFM